MDFFKRAINEHQCDWCGAERGQPCKTPTGRKAKIPHQGRQWHLVIADRIARKG